MQVWLAETKEEGLGLSPLLHKKVKALGYGSTYLAPSPPANIAPADLPRLSALSVQC